jgi:hypothetical protein
MLETIFRLLNAKPNKLKLRKFAEKNGKHMKRGGKRPDFRLMNHHYPNPRKKKKGFVH